MNDAACISHPSAQWFAAYTRSSFEKRVGEHFAVRNIEYFLPIYKVVHRWRNRCVKTLCPVLFPGYIFVRIPLVERVRVLEVPGVVSIVGGRLKPTPLSDTLITSLRTATQEHDLQPHPYLVAGTKVHIYQGPFQGLDGIVVRKTNKLRVVLSLELIMRSVSVEIDEIDVESV